MIIRSQDKTVITTDLNLQIYDCHNGNHEIVNATVDTIGVYSTEEKAIKVLDMICEHAEAVHFSKVAPNQCGQIWGNVFNMPQDSEV